MVRLSQWVDFNQKSPLKLKSIKMLIFTKIVEIFIKEIKQKGTGVSLDWWKWVEIKLERTDKNYFKNIVLKWQADHGIQLIQQWGRMLSYSNISTRSVTRC